MFFYCQIKSFLAVSSLADFGPGSAFQYVIPEIDAIEPRTRLKIRFVAAIVALRAWAGPEVGAEPRPSDEPLVLVGFSTHHGTVTAAYDWDQPARRKRVREGLPGSWEDVLHQTATGRFMLPLRTNATLRQLAQPPRLQRAIGVIYRPETERQSHYFMTHLSQQFDALIHIDETSALEPLDHGPVWHSTEPPETYPSGV